jgi:hypothetical protein
MEDVTSLVLALALLILLAATSLRFGVDSRDGFTTQQPDLLRGGSD